MTKLEILYKKRAVAKLAEINAAIKKLVGERANPLLPL